MAMTRGQRNPIYGICTLGMNELVSMIHAIVTKFMELHTVNDLRMGIAQFRIYVRITSKLILIRIIQLN